MSRTTTLGVYTLACTLIIALCSHADTVLNIHDGARIHPPKPALHHGLLYWGTADTTLDATAPNADFGGADTLRLAPRNAAILIRFDQLLPCTGGPFVDVSEATLTLHLKNPPANLPSGDAIRIFRVRNRWNEGGKDGEENYWAATHSSRFFSTDPDQAITWHTPGARSREDLIAVPGAKATYDAQTGTLRITGLAKEIRHFLDRHYENFGWLITADAQPNAPLMTFHSREAVDPAQRPTLSLTYTQTTPTRPAHDLGIAHISRYPEYYAWMDMGSYSNKTFRGVDVGILKDPAFADVPKNPEPGDMLQYTAIVVNHGSEPINGFGYRWRVNDVTQHTGIFTRTLAPGDRRRIYFSHPAPDNWDDHRDEWITLRVEPLESLTENKNNNELTIFTKGRAAGIHCDETSRDFYATHHNAIGTYNFDDWIQFQMAYWNDIYFPKSRIRDVFPDGALPRVRIQRIEYFYDHDLAGAVHIAWDDRNPVYDGMWGWDFADTDPANLTKEDWFFRQTLRMCEPSLIHEMSHQCFGLMDIYWMTMEPARNAETGEGGKVRIRDPRDPSRFLTGVGYWPAAGGLMGGGDTRYTPEHEPTDLYSDQSVFALNANARYRGGFFGDYMYSIPTNISITVIAPDGTPVKNAPLTAWQSTYFYRDTPPICDEKIVFTGMLDETGTFRLPNQPTGEGEAYTTLTGHTLRPNPFGRIHVVGFNGNILIELAHEDTYYYYMLMAWELNVAYAKGHTEDYHITWQLGPDSNIETFKVNR